MIPAPMATVGSQIDEIDSLDKYVEDDFMSIILRCGLFLGAIFQLFCIGASILLKSPNGVNNNEDGDCTEEQKSLQTGRLQKFRKQEKKKRR